MSKQTTYDKLDLLGVEIDAVSNASAIDYICTRAAPGQPAGYVVKPYVEFFDRAHREPAFADLLNRADLAIPDGVALVWAAAFLYAGRRSLWRFGLTLSQIVFDPAKLRWPLPDRAAGINFAWPMLEAAAAKHLRVFLIGKPSDHDIQATAHFINTHLPELKIVGTRGGRDHTLPAGQVGEEWLKNTQERLHEAKPDLILVGMGFPLQERVCAHLAAHLPHGIFVGEGGTFDYEAFGGTIRKAPSWMQRSGLEWLWRLLLQPAKRFRRQLAIPRFIWRIWRTK